MNDAPLKTWPEFNRIVIKIGSALLVDREKGLRNTWLEAMADDIRALAELGKQVIVVSSGAISLGRIVMAQRKELSRKVDQDRLVDGTLTLEESQAAAAIGQIELSRAYSEVLTKRGLGSGQILLTLGDTQERLRYLNARATIWTLLDWGAVPVINENDSVATSEIRYGDNDRLAARVSTMVDADLLILLSDIDGLYSTPPPSEPDEKFLKDKLIARVEKIDSKIEAMAGESNSAHSKGGMRTKIEAAKIATQAGTTMAISNGRGYHPLKSLMNGGRGTWFAPTSQPVSHRKKWIAGQLKPAGKVFIDSGAAVALNQGKSLLAAGVCDIEGEFKRGDTIVIFDQNREAEIARGLIAYDSSDAQKIVGKNSAEIESILGVATRTAMVHRDDLVLTSESTIENEIVKECEGNE